MKRMQKLTGLLFALVLVLGLSVTAMAAGLMPESKYGESGNIYFTVDDAGVLTWSEVSGATSYDLNIYVPKLRTGSDAGRIQKGIRQRESGHQCLGRLR